MTNNAQITKFNGREYFLIRTGKELTEETRKELIGEAIKLKESGIEGTVESLFTRAVDTYVENNQNIDDFNPVQYFEEKTGRRYTPETKAALDDILKPIQKSTAEEIALLKWQREEILSHKKYGIALEDIESDNREFFRKISETISEPNTAGKEINISYIDKKLDELKDPNHDIKTAIETYYETEILSKESKNKKKATIAAIAVMGTAILGPALGFGFAYLIDHSVNKLKEPTPIIKTIEDVKPAPNLIGYSNPTIENIEYNKTGITTTHIKFYSASDWNTYLKEATIYEGTTELSRIINTKNDNAIIFDFYIQNNAPGNHTYTIKAIDGNNKTTEQDIEVILNGYKNIPGDLAPKITEFTPNGKIVNGSVTIETTIRDQGENKGLERIRFYEDGRLVKENLFSNENYEFNNGFYNEKNTFNNSSGTHRYEVEVLDKNGNTTRSESLEIIFK